MKKYRLDIRSEWEKVEHKKLLMSSNCNTHSKKKSSQMSEKATEKL